MKKYLFLVATLLLTVNMTMSAQNNKRNADNRRSNQVVTMTPQERVALMTKELDLTAEQAAQVLTLTEKQDAERLAQIEKQRAERGAGIENRDARREEFRVAREKQMKEQYDELVKIIGKEKADKWNELREKARTDNRAGRRNPQNRNR